MSYILTDPTTGNQYFTISGGVITPQPLDPSSEIGWIEITNESPYLLIFQAGSLQFPVPAWTGYPIQSPSNTGFPLPMSLTPVLLGTASNAPSSVCVITVYNMQETPVQRIPYGLVRQANIGNSIAVSGASSLKNDGNSPGAQIVESTPSDQVVSAFSLNNDGSGLWQVLSAGVQRIVAQITRGNAIAGKASIVLGDPGDASLLAVHGTADNATNVGDGASGGYLTATDSGTALDLHPTAGANRMLSLSMRDTGGVLRQVFNTSASGATIFLPSAGVQLSGKITSYNGQAATGYGVPLIVAVAENVSITSTVNTLLLTFTPPADGMYRVSGYVQLANGTSGQLILFNVQYRDPALLPTQTIPIYLIPATGGAAAQQQANGSNSFPNGTYAMASLLIRAQNGVAITLRYQDPANTPNDHVSVLLERIS